jgi:hypothetical protein
MKYESEIKERCLKAVHTIIFKLMKDKIANDWWHFKSIEGFQKTQKHGVLVLKLNTMDNLMKYMTSTSQKLAFLSSRTDYTLPDEFAQCDSDIKLIIQKYLPNKQFMVCIDVEYFDKRRLDPIFLIDGITASLDKSNIGKTVFAVPIPEGLSGIHHRSEYIKNVLKTMEEIGCKLSEEINSDLTEYVKNNKPFKTIVVGKIGMLKIDCIPN